MTRLKAGIIGGTGYTGAELLRLLVQHPLAELLVISSRSEAGNRVDEVYPNLRGFCDLTFSAPDDGIFSACDVVFSATPNGIAMTHARALLEQGVRLIDLAADFRIADVDVWEHWYGMQHACPELLENAVYGLPELHRNEIAKADIVANPGCYPTATTLGFAPLLQHNLVSPGGLIADVKSGVSGAGRGASVANLFSEVSDSFKAYAASGHRHHPEVEQNLAGLAGQAVSLTFIPHLVPMLRGIHATLYADLLDADMPIEEIQQRFEQSWQDEPFVDVMPLGSHPQTRSVRGSNMCRMAIHKAVGSGKLVVLSAIDNLTKGAAGQAVQNMNIMFGIDEASGLKGPGLMP